VWDLIGSFDEGQRYQFETAMAGDRLYLVGGYANGSYRKSIRSLDLAALRSDLLPGRLSSGLTGTATATLSGKVYIVGGYNFGGSTRDVQVLAPVSRTISRGPAMFGGRRTAAAAAVDGRLFLMGGAPPTGAASSSAQVSVLTT
jgi:hypothetical protein